MYWHDNFTAVVCAKMCSDLITRNEIKARLLSNSNYEWKSFSEMGPDEHVDVRENCNIPGAFFYQHGLTLIPGWMNNHMPSKMYDEIIHPFSNVKVSTLDVC